ncbi:hypothetical protein [Rickettsia endosymbiont of Polydrusus tereticollis]|uniref:hypothetical protein n=1 Tax=Rickettsia endosymbiont of Polydrusus tereticollis TaxID=3066251 RepID=UPI003132FB90
MVFIILSTNKVNASAWLLEEGRYRYSINVSNVDKASKKEKKQREVFAREIKEEIEQLEMYAGQLKANSPDYKKILKRIKKLRQAARQLPPYQEEWFTSGAIEYGITDNQNFGVHFLFKKEKFNGKKTFNEEASLFYKLKLFQENDFVLSLQPKIFVSKNKGRAEEFFAEISLLAGMSEKIYSASVFNQNTVSIGHYLNYFGYKKRYYNVSTTEGVKFKNGFMLVSFTKYHNRQDYGYIYEKTVYEQLSVAKIIKFDNVGKNFLTTQLGYFWDQSLSNKKYKISGITFSIWLDV